jgi:small-conductance mechanosensitive channel
VNAVPLVLRNPEPHVEFLRFGTYSLDFELRFMLADMGDGLTVRNDLRIAILKRFKEEGIQIPLPQSDLTINRPSVLAPAQGEDGKAAFIEQDDTGNNGATDEEGSVRRLRSKTADGNLKS